MTGIPLQDWCNESGLCVINFSVDLEYSVLEQVIQEVNSPQPVLIHSKAIRKKIPKHMVLLDATGHTLTPSSSFLYRTKDPTLRPYLPDEKIPIIPSNTQVFVSKLGMIREKLADANWWIWWSPSHLVAQNVDDLEIIRTLRIISKDFAKHHFLVLVAGDVHSSQGIALLKLIADYYVEVVPDIEQQLQWRLAKHPDLKKEGQIVVA